jgi:cation diffusion facilitator CzcD-associated flavoprotein CzcO
MLVEHFDVLIIGGGIAGIGAACMLQRSDPRRRFAILEARDALGGTWDLFRYPGVRSDTDMYTLGYSFRPWRESSALAGGAAILRYIRETAAEHGVDRHVRYQHRVRRVSWTTSTAQWDVEVERGPEREPVCFSARFLFACTGYYDYDAGYQPDFPGRAQFTGTLVHPQSWPPTLGCTAKRVVVIGSGATAVTLVPALARTAGHVTLLQRSPSYILSAPTRSATLEAL